MAEIEDTPKYLRLLACRMGGIADRIRLQQLADRLERPTEIEVELLAKAGWEASAIKGRLERPWADLTAMQQDRWRAGVAGILDRLFPKPEADADRLRRIVAELRDHTSLELAHEDRFWLADRMEAGL